MKHLGIDCGANKYRTYDGFELTSSECESMLKLSAELGVPMLFKINDDKSTRELQSAEKIVSSESFTADFLLSNETEVVAEVISPESSESALGETEVVTKIFKFPSQKWSRNDVHFVLINFIF